MDNGPEEGLNSSSIHDYLLPNAGAQPHGLRRNEGMLVATVTSAQQ